MIIVRGMPTRLYYAPVNGLGTDIKEGAVLMRGAVATDSSAKTLSNAVLASAAAPDAIGLLAKKHVASGYDADPYTGLVSTVIETTGSAKPIALFHPGGEVAAEYSQATADVLAVTSATSTVITISSLEDNIDGCWIYVVSGVGIGQLEYVVASASGSCTVKSAMTTTLTSASKIIILKPLFHKLHVMTSDCTKLSTTAAAGTLPWINLKNEIKYNGLEGWRVPDPIADHDKQFGSSGGFVSRSILAPVTFLLNP